MRPANLKTRIFLDSGDPRETRELISLLGFLDGQTTNPTLIAKNPETRGKKFTEQEVYDFYKKVVQELSGLMPQGSISIEVYADFNTPATSQGSTSPFPPQAWGGSRRGERSLLGQAKEMFTWIPNAHIKFPTNHEGLKAAEQAVKEGMRINMTLCFSQEQAAAVYAATRGAKKGQVFVSPFVGRLDDIGENGMDLIKNIIEMYKTPSSSPPYQGGEGGGGGASHVEVLTASVRNMEHMRKALELGSDIITAPFGILKEWAENDLSRPPATLPRPGEGKGERSNLKPIPYRELDLNKPRTEFDIRHPLTDKGMQKFSDDWNALIKGS